MKLKYVFEIMELDEDIIAVPVGEGALEYHELVKLNDSALRIFSLLADNISEKGIIDILYEEYGETQRSQLEEYVHSFLTKLAEKGLLVE